MVFYFWIHLLTCLWAPRQKTTFSKLSSKICPCHCLPKMTNMSMFVSAVSVIRTCLTNGEIRQKPPTNSCTLMLWKNLFGKISKVNLHKYFTLCPALVNFDTQIHVVDHEQPILKVALEGTNSWTV